MRGLVRFLAALFGAAAVLLGALLAVEVVVTAVDPAGAPVSWPGVRSVLGGLAWNGVPVRIAAGVLTALGLLLAVLAVLAGRREVRLRDPAPEVTVTTDARSLARLVGHRVREDEDVASAAVTASRRRVRVRAVSAVSSADGLRPRLSETTEQTVRALSPLRQPRVSVSVARAKENR